MDNYDRFSADLHEHFTRDPNRRAALGVSGDLARLPDPSPEGLAAQLDEARALLERAHRLTPQLSDVEQRIDLEVGAEMLSYELHKETLLFNGLTRAQQTPSAGSDIGDGIFYLFANDPRPAAERLADITGRVQAVPAYLEGLLRRLVRPVARWADMEQEQIEGLPELFGHLQSWADAEVPAGALALRQASARAVAALQDYSARLRQLPTSPSLHIDEANARELVRLRGIDLPFEDLHALATEFLARTNASVEALRAKLVARYGLPDSTSAAELQSFFQERYAVKLPTGRMSDIVERYQREELSLSKFLTDHNLFPIPADQQILILETPSFLAPQIPAGAMSPPPPFREGTRQSLMYLTLSEDLLGEHNELEIPGMMLHEGIPGHHLQLTWASMHPSIIRRHVDSNDLAEGWTTMLEDFMLDVGYCGELTDEARFAGRRGLARLAARVSIDLFFMTGQDRWLEIGVPYDREGDAFAKAGSLLAAVTGFSPARVHAELNWNSLERGYPLSYLAGNYLMWGLRRDFDAANPHSSPRDFHEAVLRAGNLPLSVMRRLFQAKGLLRAA